MAGRDPRVGWTRWRGPSTLAAGLAAALVAGCGSGPATPSRDTPLPPLPTVTTTLAPTTTRVPFYDVQRGDTMQSISEKLGITDPNVIKAGQRLTVPAAPVPAETTTAPP
jgi:hypothetical protein